MTYTLIKRDGTKTEVPFLIVNGKEHISEHITKVEFAQKDSGKVIIHESLIKLFEAVRVGIGKPLKINSGFRDEEYQKHLYEADLKAHGGKPSGKVAKPGYSPHATGAAMDIAVPDGHDSEGFAKLIRNTSDKIGLPTARTGYKKYGGVFVHIDLVPIMFEPYTKIKNPQREFWRPGVTW